jgi:hypothetical protein
MTPDVLDANCLRDKVVLRIIIHNLKRYQIGTAIRQPSSTSTLIACSQLFQAAALGGATEPVAGKAIHSRINCALQPRDS